MLQLKSGEGSLAVAQAGSRGRKPDIQGCLRVSSLPAKPAANECYWLSSPAGRGEYTHQLFRFPAKLYAPVVRWALDEYGGSKGLVLDPFTGSATVQVETLLRGIPSLGIDLDPLACLIARVKTTPLDPAGLERALDRINAFLRRVLRAHVQWETTPGTDITELRFERECRRLAIPLVPGITHWFRRYVIVDLARLLNAIRRATIGGAERRFFEACFAAIVRRVSNADPRPVSGLEVTRIQAARNAQRTIRVFDEFFAKAEQAIFGMGQLWAETSGRRSRGRATVVQGDVLDIAGLWQKLRLQERGVSLVVTSPPYCRAVEYSRRHRLEMYWLGLVQDQTEHLALSHSYIGRPLVRPTDWNDQVRFSISGLDRVLQRIQTVDVHLARTLKHYFWSMQRVLEGLAGVTASGGTLVLVAGDSVCRGIPVSTAEFIGELASRHFTSKNRFSYALRNYHMQYGLRNGHGIKREHVLVFRAR